MTTSKNKTNFRIALPPPRSKHQQRLHIPPKRLLQLQLLSDTLHTSTYFDVVPAVQHSANVQQKILNQLRCPFHFKSGDLVITRSPNDDDLDDGSIHLSNKKHLASEKDADVVAIIRKASKDSDRAEMSMDTGRVWNARRLRSGSYEFACSDKNQEARIARWAPKQAPFSVADAAKGQIQDRAFTFSLLNPNERRHAVIAKLSPDGIDVCNTYRDPRPVTPPNDEASEGERDERPLNRTSEDLKTFILTSAAWVGLMEGYSPCFPLKSSDSKTQKASHESSTNGSSHSIVTTQSRHIRGHSNSLGSSRVTESSPAIPQQSLQQPREPVSERSFSTGRLDSRGHRRFSGFNKSHYDASHIVSKEPEGSPNDPSIGPIKTEKAVQSVEPKRLATETDAVTKKSGRDRTKEEKRFSGVFRGWHRR